MAKGKKRVPGQLYNKEAGYPYPKGKTFYSEEELDQALADGWKETPYDKTPLVPSETPKNPGTPSPEPKKRRGRPLRNALNGND